MKGVAQINPSCILTFARDNNSELILKAVQAYGIAVDWANGIGQTALHVAALHGNLEASLALLELGMDVNRTNMRGSTPLHFAAAAKRNTVQICKLLLEHGADDGIVDDAGRLPYELANGDDVRALLGGPDPRLYDFAAHGNLEGLRALFAEDPEQEADVFNQEGKAALHLAAAGGHMGCVNFLLERGTYINMQDWQGNTAAHHAVREGHSGVLALLIRKGADLSVQNFQTSEYAQGNWLSAGQQLNPLHQTPLHLAVEAGDGTLAAQLLEGGAPVGALDFDRKSPLHLALEMQDDELVELLLEHGADVNQGCKDFASPLHLAASRGMQHILLLLLAKGAAVNAADEQGWTPLMLAVRGGKFQAVKALLAAGADAAVTNQQGSTAAHLAAVNGKPEVLLIGNAAGALPTDVAKNAEVRDLLASRGSSRS
ncbi:hypothetical protein N2152v2_003757 [Parachlorella kessleri]